MTQYTPIYNNNLKVSAAEELHKNVLIYIVCAVFFAAFCVGFVLLYKFAQFNIFACLVANVALTIAFAWYSVIFFTLKLPQMKQKKAFFALEENSLPQQIYATFLTQLDREILLGQCFCQMQFSCVDGRVVILLVSENVANIFCQNQTYALKTVGKFIFAYQQVQQ